MLAVVAVALLAADRFGALRAVRPYIELTAVPFYWLADLPMRISEWADTNLSTVDQLRAENERLRTDRLAVAVRLLRLEALEAENRRLRELLDSSSLLDERVRVAEVVGISPDPSSQRVMLNKGGGEGVRPGMPVLDAYGLMGQVVEVTPISSRIMLITDDAHAVPVQVNRTGLRAVAEGTGNPNALEIRYIGTTADVREGDLLVTSGLGGVFPPGYPVGVVSSVENDPGETFAVVKAQPSAQLARSRHVLMVYPSAAEARESDGPAGQAATDAPADAAGAP